MFRNYYTILKTGKYQLNTPGYYSLPICFAAYKTSAVTLQSMLDLFVITF